MEEDLVKYEAAGAVVVHDELVLVLERPSRQEIRLPKGHTEADEDYLQTALRETAEESGFANLKFIAPLGAQMVKFAYKGKQYERLERYFLLERRGSLEPDSLPEKQFKPRWVKWEEAESLLTFEPEREWVRRARQMWKSLKE